jgi:hypothetical protein
MRSLGHCSVSIRVLIPIALGVAIALAGQEGATTKPGFRLSATMPATMVRAGTPILVDFAFTNTSDRILDVHMNRIRGPVFEEQFRQMDVELRDSEGKPIPETEYGKTIHGRSVRPPEPAKHDAPGVGMGGRTGVMGALPSGETFRETSDLNEEFDLRKPGTYMVRASRKDAFTAETVYSNEITFVLLK